MKDSTDNANNTVCKMLKIYENSIGSCNEISRKFKIFGKHPKRNAVKNANTIVFNIFFITTSFLCLARTGSSYDANVDYCKHSY